VRWLVTLLMSVLLSCTSATERSEQQYAIVEKSGNAADLCKAGRELVDAYLKANDADGYNRRKVETSIACQARTMDEESGDFRMPDGSTKHIEADNMDAMPDTTIK